jgi:hypothetical protein
MALIILLFIHSPITNTPLGPHTFISILLSKTHNQSSYLNVRDQFPHAHSFSCASLKKLASLIECWQNCKLDAVHHMKIPAKFTL